MSGNPAPVSLGQRIAQLANEVASSTPGAAERLYDLSDAVEGGQAADIWAAADIFQVIDPDTIAEQVRARGVGDSLLRFLEVLRNALVFAPIAVTWIGIWLAFDAYDRAISADPDLAEQSFLYLWQQGFDGRLMLTLSDIAFIDGALLLIVFVLTIIVLSRNNQKDHYAETIRDELASVLADASLALTARRSRQTASFVTQFDRMAQELLTEMRQERARVGELASRKEKEVGDLTTMTRDFMTSTQGMLAAVQSLQHVPQQLGRIMTALTSSFQQLTDQHKEQQQEFTTATRQATTQLQQLADEYRTMSMDMQMMSTNLQATGTSLQTMGTDLQTMGADLRDSIDTTRKTSTQSAQAMSDMRTVAGNLVAAQTEFLAALGHERGMLEKSTQSMNTTIQALQQTQQSLEQRIDILAQTLQQMTSQQQEMGTDLRAALDTLQTAVADIASASREMQAALLAAREDS